MKARFRRSRFRKLTLRTVVLGLVALAVAVGAATAGLEAVVDDGVIKACRHKSGYLLVPSPGKACKKAEQALSWNVKPDRPGLLALPARRAPPGRSVQPGRPGPPGSDGTIDAIEALGGIACTTADDTLGNGVRRDRDRRRDRAHLRGRCAASTGTGESDARHQRARLRPGRRGCRRLRRDRQHGDRSGRPDGHRRRLRRWLGRARVPAQAAQRHPRPGRVPVCSSRGAERRTRRRRAARHGRRRASGRLVLRGSDRERRRRRRTPTASSRERSLPASVADSNTAAGSLARIPDGSDTNDAATDWAFTTVVTPGAGNVAG